MIGRLIQVPIDGEWYIFLWQEPALTSDNSSPNCGISWHHASGGRHERGMVSAQAAAVQRDDHLSVRLRRAAKPHRTAAGGERGALQGEGRRFHRGWNGGRSR